MKIALAGNPNSGKTTMFNALTGSFEKVGNWAGVTVEKKERTVKKIYCAKGEEVLAVDLPGAYSMSAFTSEETIAAAYVTEEAPDVIINIVDATNLSRSLFFTTQLMELGIAVVVALNKTDINEKKQTEIDTHKLSRLLGCPVIATTSTTGEGLTELMAAAAEVCGKGQNAPFVGTKTEREDEDRFDFVKTIVAKVEQRRIQTKDRNDQDRIDVVLTHPVLGLAIFAGVMFLVFQISQAWVGPWIADRMVGWIDACKVWVAGMLDGGNTFLVALLSEGVIGGFSAVLGFLPLVMVMYFLISLLEDCGYMARATVVLDPVFKKVGLSGKSVIPFVIGTGCAIPGVMAVRTIRNERERNATAMLTPFMPCGAKLPVIALFAGAFFGDASWVGTLMYFVGIVLILLCTLLVNKIAGYDRKRSYFIIELPQYKLPSLRRAFLDMCSRGKEYIVKAGTVILLCNAVVFMMQSFDWQLRPVEEGMEQMSVLATVAEPIAVILVPVIGIKAWQMAAAAVTGFIAKENVVGTLAVCYGISNLIDTEELALVGAGSDVASVFAISKAAALAYLMFNLFTPPCFAAIGAMNAEIKNKKWLWGGIALQLCVGYTVGYLVYTVGTLLTEPASLHPGAAVGGGAAVLVMAAVMVCLCARAGRRVKAEYSLSGGK